MVATIVQDGHLCIYVPGCDVDAKQIMYFESKASSFAVSKNQFQVRILWTGYKKQ